MATNERSVNRETRIAYRWNILGDDGYSLEDFSEDCWQVYKRGVTEDVLLRMCEDWSYELITFLFERDSFDVPSGYSGSFSLQDINWDDLGKLVYNDVRDYIATECECDPTISGM